MEKEDPVEVLNLAMEAGKILLENGAEISRVEETMERICRHYGVNSEQLFVLSNGILMSAGNTSEPEYARVRHIPVRGGRLDLLCAVNDLSRRIQAGQYTVQKASEILGQIRNHPAEKLWKLILAGGIGSGAFCCLFGGGAKETAAAFLVGLLVQLFMTCAADRYLSKPVGTICGGALITLLCILFAAAGFGSELDKMIIGCVMLLVPGVAFVNGIRDIADADYISGVVRLSDALLRFFCIAIGVGIVFYFYHRWFGGMIL